MDAIVATDDKWGIGYNNELLFKIPEDMSFFKTMTMGKTIIVGRKTLESFPNGKPLPSRENIILSSQIDYKCNKVKVVNDIEKLIDLYGHKDGVIVVGGGSIYRQLLPYCKRVYRTHIYQTYHADTYFPNLYDYYNWQLISQSDFHHYNDIKFKYEVFKNMNCID